MKDYYQILRISPGASQEEIKSSYHKLAREFHPDKNPSDPSSLSRFQDIQEAYDYLKRSKSGDIYSEIYLEDLKPANFSVTVLVTEPCIVCQGRSCRTCQSGLIQKTKRYKPSLPPGLKAGDKLKLVGCGHQYNPQDAAGDLYLIFKSRPPKPSPSARPPLEVPITLTQAILGDSCLLETSKGQVSIKIPPGTQPHDEYVLKGYGEDDQDLTYQFKVIIPRATSPEQYHLLQALAHSFEEKGGSQK